MKKLVPLVFLLVFVLAVANVTAQTADPLLAAAIANVGFPPAGDAKSD